MTDRTYRALIVALVVAVALVAGPSRADAHHSDIHGSVTDAMTGAALADVCVTLGPPIRCFTRTDASGFYRIDLAALAARDGQTWDMYFLKSPGYQTVYSDKFVVDGPVTLNVTLMPTGQRELCPAASTAQPTQTVYLANVTKTLGGADGWQTPFIVQNTGATTARLEITYQRFLNGACVVRRSVPSLLPGTSFADVPNNDHDLPGDTQFAVVVRSFGATIVSVVNQHSGAGARAEALSYVGVSAGAQSVFLPNITRRFFGYVTPFIMQNLGANTAQATAAFVSFDGSAPRHTVTRSIPAGSSKFIDPNSEAGLVDGKQYSVTVTSDQPLSVIVNTHNDAPTVAAPVAYSTNGIATGSPTVYGPYAAKNAAGVGRVSTVVVQNLGAAPITPSLEFNFIGGSGSTQTFTSPATIAGGASWAFDPRFTVGTTTPCSVPSATCLGDGEYSFVARSGSPTTNIAVAVNVISDKTAMGYTALPSATARAYLPNVTRRLGGEAGWSTPVILQSIGAATGATVRWYSFTDGSLVLTQAVTMAPGRAVRIDPRDVVGLRDDAQYAVVVDGIGGSVGAIVMELASGGDNAMIYEGFAVTAAPTP